MHRITWFLGALIAVGCGGAVPTESGTEAATGADAGSNADACAPFSTHESQTDDAGVIHPLHCHVEPTDTAHADCARQLIQCDHHAYPASRSCVEYGCSDYWCCDIEYPPDAPFDFTDASPSYPTDATDCKFIFDPTKKGTCNVRAASLSPGPICNTELIECTAGAKPSLNCTWYPCTNFWCCAPE